MFLESRQRTEMKNNGMWDKSKMIMMKRDDDVAKEEEITSSFMI